MEKVTMIKLDETTREKLKKLKIIPRDTYNDVLLRLIGKNEKII